MAVNDQDKIHFSAQDPRSSAPRQEGNDPLIESGDQQLRDFLADYTPKTQIEGWEKLSASLDAADKAFDEEIRSQIRKYHAPYDPHAWSTFARRVSAQRNLRSRLILIKISEAVAILLLILTTLQLPELNTVPPTSMPATDIAASESGVTDEHWAENHTSNPGDALIPAGHQDLGALKNRSAVTATNNTTPEKASIPLTASFQNPVVTNTEGAAAIESSVTTEENIVVAEWLTQPHPETGTANPVSAAPQETSFDFLQTLDSRVLANHITPEPMVSATPILVGKSNTKYLELGLLMQADYNQLKMPGNKVNTNNKQFVFPLQGLTSPGYGAGLTIAVGHPKWALETGAIYNAKSFNPDREVTVDDALAASSIELEEMKMQLISIPLQVRYRFDAAGRLKTYAQAGFGMHLIMQSHADVDVEYDFPTLMEGADPSTDPTLTRTIRQTQRASDELRKQAPFSTNSLISANIGLGLEYEFMEDKNLFIQSVYQYQIPNLRFQDHSNKHLLTLSFQVGVRAPLGR